MEDNHVDKLIQSAINKLAEGSYESCAQDLHELAVQFAGAGLTLKSFVDMRTYIVESAKKTSKDKLIEEKLKEAEKANGRV